jgi:hypothetical protein
MIVWTYRFLQIKTRLLKQINNETLANMEVIQKLNK